MKTATIKKKIGKPSNIYRVTVKFMEGDADGWEYEKIDIPKDEWAADDVQELLEVIEKAQRLDRKGRGGMDTVTELFKHYRKAGITTEQCQKYLGLDEWDDNEQEVAVEAAKYSIESFPSDSEGYYHSVRSLNCSYFDEKGDEWEVELK